MAEDHPNHHQQQQQQQQQQQPQIPPSQAALSSVRLQHFNYLSPAASQAAQQQQQQPPPPPTFQSAVGPGPERRHYSFDTDTESARYPLGPLPPVDYDQTEGLGGISVSSYDSIDDDRIDPAMRGYPYHGEKQINYHASDHNIPYMASPLYASNSSYPVEEAAGYARNGDRTPSDISSSISPPNGVIGNNKYSTIPPGERLARALSIEEQSRLVVEEDKRRRNTAASARFRVKKKQREQALERAVREATEVKASLEARVTQLEMENRWLKNLLTEKNENLLSRLAALQPPSEGGLPTDKSLDDVPSSSSSLLPPLSSSSTSLSTSEQQQHQQQPKKSDSASATSQKPIKPKPTVGVGTDDKK